MPESRRCCVRLGTSPTAEQAERVLRNLARRLDHDAPGVSISILEGLDEMLTVIRIGLPDQLRRSLGCTNAIESLMAVLRTVCRNVKRWRDARMALRWTGTAMLEAEKSFRRLKAHKQLPILRAALLAEKTWQHRIQPMAPASPISTGTGTIAVHRNLRFYDLAPPTYFAR
jgi:putative transposase